VVLRRPDGSLTRPAKMELRQSAACQSRLLERRKATSQTGEAANCSWHEPACCVHPWHMAMFGPCWHIDQYAPNATWHSSLSSCSALAGNQLAYLSMLRRVVADTRPPSGAASRRGIVWLLDDDVRLAPGWSHNYASVLAHRPPSSWDLLKLTGSKPDVPPAPSRLADERKRSEAQRLLMQFEHLVVPYEQTHAFSMGAAAIALHSDNASRVMDAMDEVTLGTYQKSTLAIDFAVAIAHITRLLNVEDSPLPIARPEGTLGSTQDR